MCLFRVRQANEAQKRPKTFEEVDAENERNELEVLAKKFESKYVSRCRRSYCCKCVCLKPNM